MDTELDNTLYEVRIKERKTKKEVTLVSVCVHFLKLLDTQTQKWTQSLTKIS